MLQMQQKKLKKIFYLTILHFVSFHINMRKKNPDMMRPKRGHAVAVHARIPSEVYAVLETLMSVTQKSAATLVKDAIIFYCESVRSGKIIASEGMQIDQYAWRLRSKNKPK